MMFNLERSPWFPPWRMEYGEKRGRVTFTVELKMVGQLSIYLSIQQKSIELLLHARAPQ